MKVNVYRHPMHAWRIIYKRELSPGTLHYLELILPLIDVWEIVKPHSNKLHEGFVDMGEHWMYSEISDEWVRDQLIFIGAEVVFQPFDQGIHGKRGVTQI